MSDYEGEGWQPVALPVRSDPARHYSDALTEHTGQVVPDHYIKGTNYGRRDKSSLRPQSARSFHPLLQNIQPRAHHGTGGRSVERTFGLSTDNQNSESFRLFQARPDQSDDVFLLDVPWRDLLRAIPDTAEMSARDIAQNHLDNIGVYSEAFLRTPEPESVRVEIWGTEERCQKAKSRLQAWEQHLRKTGPRSSQKQWPRMAAYDGRREDRKRQEVWQQLEDQALQEWDDDYFEYEAYLVWPQDYDLDAYLNKYEASTLKDIARQFRCRFKHEKKTRPRLTRVQAETEDNLLAVYQRLINLVKEMVSQSNRGTHGNFVRLPSPEVYHDQVLVERAFNRENSPYRGKLFGDQLPDDETQRWIDSVKLYDKQNRTELRASIDAFLRRLYVSRCHMRLRVSFGELMLHNFTTPRSGEPTFKLEEYLTMLQKRRTQATDPILRDYHQGDFALLVDKFSSMEELESLPESYKQIFHFKCRDNTSILRLEIEMQPGYDADEPQVCSQRWLDLKTYVRNENVLGLKMFDFERPGYMIRADAYNLVTNDSLIKEKEWFRGAVSFKPSQGGIKARPGLRSSFPNDDKLLAVFELVSQKFQLKGTDGILEVQREDLFLQKNGPPSKLPNDTSFQLLYYYPEWDNLLGELSNNKPGEDVSWSRDIQTFFPDYIDPDRPRSLPRGFKTFIEEVHKVQLLIGEAMTLSPDGKGKQPSDHESDQVSTQLLD